MKQLLLSINDDLDYDLIRLLLNKLHIKFEEVMFNNDNNFEDNYDEKEQNYINILSDSIENETIYDEEQKVITRDISIDRNYGFSDITIDVIIKTVKLIQRNYFLSGKEKHIVPMVYKDIADIVNRNISSVARVLEGKEYILFGKVLYYKDLFSSHDFSTFDGRPVSRFEVCDIISELITKENKYKPLTDDAIADELKHLGYNIARRTVAKYRDQILKLPSTIERRNQ